MKLKLHWRGRDVIDIEVHCKLRKEEPEFEASGGGQFELAEPMPYPDTSVRIGFQATSRGPSRSRVRPSGGRTP